jgi:hypothetical protein
MARTVRRAPRKVPPSALDQLAAFAPMSDDEGRALGERIARLVSEPTLPEAYRAELVEVLRAVMGAAAQAEQALQRIETATQRARSLNPHLTAPGTVVSVSDYLPPREPAPVVPIGKRPSRKRRPV